MFSNRSFIEIDLSSHHYFNWILKVHNDKVRVQSYLQDSLKQIINTAIKISSRFDLVIIDGEDIDLIVLLIVLAGKEKKVFFPKPEKESCFITPIPSSMGKHYFVVVQH